MLTKEWVDALNQIYLIFYDDKQVKDAWFAYYESLLENSQFKHEMESRKDNLLTTMAKQLGYPSLSQLEIQRVYIPRGFQEQASVQLERDQVGLDVLKMMRDSAKATSSNVDTESKL